jgi:hypothetical protein
MLFIKVKVLPVTVVRKSRSTLANITSLSVTIYTWNPHSLLSLTLHALKGTYFDYITILAHK